MELKANYRTVKNEEKQGIELYFDTIPCKEDREILKSNGYRWNNAKRCWYIKEKKANAELKSDSAKKVLKNELGIKVGDIFEMNWGYEQTQTDFFKVTALRGSRQIVIKEVEPKIVDVKGISSMSADYTYDLTNTTEVKRPTFVKDNQKGLVKQVQGTKERPYLNMTSFANAYLVRENKSKAYESWYA